MVTVKLGNNTSLLSSSLDLYKNETLEFQTQAIKT